MALLLTEDDVLRIVTMPMALEAVETAQRALGQASATNHPRRRHRTEKGLLHVMDAALPGLGVMGLKAYTTFRGDVNRFHVLLYSSDDGTLQAVVEADHLGRYRTGAASGVATRWLARPDARTLGVLGAGRQAVTQVLAVCAVRPIETVRVWSRSPDRAEAFCRGLAGIAVSRASSAEHTVRGADVVVTATTSREPVLRSEWLSDGVHVNAMGANSLQKREIDRASVLRASLVAVDSVGQAKVESAALVDVAQSGQRDWSDIADLGDIIAGKTPGRTSPSQITLFFSHGIAAWDLALAKRVLDEARHRDLGTEISTL